MPAADASSRALSGAGQSAVRESGASAAVADACIAGVQNEVFTLEKNLFRTETQLRSSLTTLDGLWQSLRHRSANASARDARRSREAAALVATARWAYASALARRETRGMHRRVDFPALDPAQQHYQIASGLETVSVRADASAPPFAARELALVP
jgi:succinate dehydrogenase/fumarate reductase flavoprotein subunit